MPTASYDSWEQRSRGGPLAGWARLESLLAREVGRVDWINPLCMLLLAIAGLFFIYSAHAYRGANNTFWLRQVIWLGVGGGVYLITATLRYQAFYERAHLFYAAALLLLLALPIIGVERNAAKSWIVLGPFSFQPAEAAKAGILIYVSALLARSPIGSVRASKSVLLKVFAITALPGGLIFLQPDLGSCLILPPMVFGLLYVARLSRRFFVATFAVGLVGLGLLAVDIVRYVDHYHTNGLDFYVDRGQYEPHSWLPLRDYQRTRILSFVAPEVADPKGIDASWNYRQSLISVGTGGLVGKGWTQGTQARLGYLPQSVAHNDFIFSVLSEEMGFLGGLAVLGIFAVLVGNTLRIAGQSRDRFGLLVATGVAIVFMVHIVINIGMTIGLMPITGLPLPFVSYGGSFILGCCFLQGLVQSIHRWRRDFA